MPLPRFSRRHALRALGASFLSAAVAPRALAQVSSTTTPAAALQLQSLRDYEVSAQEKISRVVWEFIQSGSADELTLQRNRDALIKLQLQPRAMVNVSAIDTSITLLGRKLIHPILHAPTAAHMQVHPEGEVATARGAEAANAIMVASTVGNRAIGDVTAAAKTDVWFQLYVAKDAGRTRDLVARAEAAGCKALCVTVDLPINYAPNRVNRVQPQLPHLPLPNLDIKAGPLTAIRGLRSDTFDWKELEALQRVTRLPILLKGIQHPEDAERAVKAGVAGIIVSNHGGRALDGTPATIELLPRITDKVAGRIPVLVDGGFRRGTDVVKALAFGASAVLIGRPYLHGLGVNGSDGVRHVVDILRTELQVAMALVGCTRIDAIDRNVIWKG